MNRDTLGYVFRMLGAAEPLDFIARIIRYPHRGHSGMSESRPHQGRSARRNAPP